MDPGEAQAVRGLPTGPGEITTAFNPNFKLANGRFRSLPGRFIPEWREKPAPPKLSEEAEARLEELMKQVSDSSLSAGERAEIGRQVLRVMQVGRTK